MDQAVVSVYRSNVLDNTREATAPMWIITEMTSDITLESFVNQHRSAITFQDAITLTRRLLDIVARCHRAHVLHRNLHPSHILVQGNHNHLIAKEIQLVLISFGLALIDDERTSGSQPVLSDQQRRNAMLDSTGVCRILFWLLTNHWLVDLFSPISTNCNEFGKFLEASLEFS